MEDRPNLVFEVTAFADSNLGEGEEVTASSGPVATTYADPSPTTSSTLSAMSSFARHRYSEA